MSSIRTEKLRIVQWDLNQLWTVPSMPGYLAGHETQTEWRAQEGFGSGEQLGKSTVITWCQTSPGQQWEFQVGEKTQQLDRRAVSPASVLVVIKSHY